MRCPNPYCMGLFTPLRRHVDEGDQIAMPEDGEVISFADAMSSSPPPEKLATGIEGFDHVMDGGLVLGDVFLFTGDPGIGKTSLMVQVAFKVAKRYRFPVLYVTGEQSTRTMGNSSARLLSGKRPPANMLLVKQTNVDETIDLIDEHRPKFVIIDSMQTVDIGDDSDPGSAKALKTALSIFARQAQAEEIAVGLVGHITKDHDIGGPKSVEHLADAAIKYEYGPAGSHYRILSCPHKNRHGETQRWALFEMDKEQGLIDRGPLTREALAALAGTVAAARQQKAP